MTQPPPRIGWQSMVSLAAPMVRNMSKTSGAQVFFATQLQADGKIPLTPFPFSC